MSDHIDWQAIARLWSIDEWYRFEERPPPGPRGRWQSGEGDETSGEVEK